MRTLSVSDKHALVAVLILSASVGGFLLLNARVTGLHGELDTYRRDEQTEDLQQRTRQAVHTLVADTAPDRLELESRMLTMSDPAPFLELIEALGADAGVALAVESLTEESGMQDTQGAKGKTQAEPFVRVTLTVSGSFEGVYHVLSLLESLPYAATVDKVAIESREGDASPLWEGTIQVRVHTQSN